MITSELNSKLNSLCAYLVSAVDLKSDAKLFQAQRDFIQFGSSNRIQSVFKGI